MCATDERSPSNVPPEPEATVREAWDAAAMARAEALELAEAQSPQLHARSSGAALDGDAALAALEAKLRDPRPR